MDISRRTLGIGALAAAAEPIFSRAANAQTPKDIEREKLNEQIIAKIIDLSDRYGLEVRVPRLAGSRTHDAWTIEYGPIAEEKFQLRALEDLESCLAKYPEYRGNENGKSLKGIVKRITISSELKSTTARCRTVRIGGAAGRGDLHVTINRHKDSRQDWIAKVFEFDSRSKKDADTQVLPHDLVDHEIGHEVMPNITQQEWIALVNRKLITLNATERFVPEYLQEKYDCTYEVAANTKKERPKGYANYYSLSNHLEDMASAVEL